MDGASSSALVTTTTPGSPVFELKLNRPLIAHDRNLPGREQQGRRQTMRTRLAHTLGSITGGLGGILG